MKCVANVTVRAEAELIAVLPEGFFQVAAKSFSGGAVASDNDSGIEATPQDTVDGTRPHGSCTRLASVSWQAAGRLNDLPFRIA